MYIEVVTYEVLDVFKIATAFFAFLLKRLVVVENLVIRKVCKCNCFYAGI